MELETRFFLAGPDLQARRLVAGELRSPLSRPADDDDQPFARPLEVEIRQIAIGGASARRGDALGRPRLESRLERLEIVCLGRGYR